MTVSTRAALEANIQARAAEDTGFRAELLADPRSAICDLFGVEIPELVTITVHEDDVDYPSHGRSTHETRRG